MSALYTRDNPLHIPEIRSRVSRYVSVADAISCVRVCKAWSMDFAFPIWYSVNFSTQRSFEQLDAEAIVRHGHLIRRISNIATQGQLNAVLLPTISKVRVLSVQCLPFSRFRILCMDLIRNNNKSLHKLVLTMDAAKSTTDRMISLGAVIPRSCDSRLTYIRLGNVHFSRASFVALLRSCPLLEYVDLQNNVALFSGAATDTFQHTGVAFLTVALETIFKPDPDSGVSAAGYSLLVHFPNLVDWAIHSRGGTTIVPIEQIMTEVRMCCPQLSQIDLSATPSSLLYDLVARVFRNLVVIKFLYGTLSVEIVLGFLLHKATLLDVSAIWNRGDTDTERDDLSLGDDHFQTSGVAIQLLLRSCPKLEVFRLEDHVMDMDIVEEDEWACKDLHHFRVRVRGLDTKEKIDRTIRLWRQGKKSESQVAQGTTIEERVARHLLKFDGLESVWLGTRTFKSLKG